MRYKTLHFSLHCKITVTVNLTRLNKLDKNNQATVHTSHSVPVSGGGGGGGCF